MKTSEDLLKEFSILLVEKEELVPKEIKERGQKDMRKNKKSQ